MRDESKPGRPGSFAFFDTPNPNNDQRDFNGPKSNDGPDRMQERDETQNQGNERQPDNNNDNGNRGPADQYSMDYPDETNNGGRGRQNNDYESEALQQDEPPSDVVFYEKWYNSVAGSAYSAHGIPSTFILGFTQILVIIR